MSAAPTANSVGVLLFNNQTRDTSYAYLADGLATEIATSLAHVPRLEVRSPGAVRNALRSGITDPTVLGRRLNVRYLVEGDYQRGGDRIRISVRLVSLPSETQRWSDAYTRPVTDLLAVQEEIASAVATAIAGELLPQERHVLAARPTTNPEAYDHVLRGNFQLAKRSPGGVLRAIDEYTQATRLDPSYALAHARIALGYALFLDWGWVMPGVSSDSEMNSGFRAADRALAIDSLSADGWMARGYLLGLRDQHQLAEAIADLRRSTELDPRNPEAWHQYASWLASLGLFEESNAASRRALALEPGRAISWMNIANVGEVTNRVQDAITAYDSAIAADPEMYAIRTYRTFCRLTVGDLEGATADAQAAQRFSPASEQYYGLAALTAVAAARGDSAEVRRLSALLLAEAGTRREPFVTTTVAMGLTMAGDRQGALAVLERTEPQGGILWLTLHFIAMRPLRGDPRFQRLVDASRPAGAREP